MIASVLDKASRGATEDGDSSGQESLLVDSPSSRARGRVIVTAAIKGEGV